MSLVDLDRMREVAVDCGWSLGELAERYLKTIDEGLAEVAAGIESGKANTVRRAAHGLYGTTTTCGVEVFAAPFRQMEKAGEDSRLEDAAAVLRDVVERLHEVRRVLEEAAK